MFFAVCKEHMERTAEKHIREIYSEQELEQMDSIEEAAPWLGWTKGPGPDRQSRPRPIVTVTVTEVLKYCLLFTSSPAAARLRFASSIEGQ